MVSAARRGAFCAATALLLLLQVVGAAEYARQGYSRRRGIKIPRITTTSTTSTQAPEHPPMQIPLDIIMRLSEIENITDFLEHFVDRNSVSQDDFLASRFGETDERKAIQHAKLAVCKPELQTVRLYPNDNPLEVAYPSCTRIERCGGCCGHSLLSCQPTDSEIVNFQVYITEYRGGDLLQQQRKEVVSVERHLKCKCSCIIKEEDCNKLQKYIPNECACTCQNTDEEEKCTNQQNIKLWDPHECSCKCRNTRECTTGFFFDPDSCSCQPSNRWRTPGVEFPGSSVIW
ncbi:vascular endothelial growth factor D-like [Schistocerca piceifrons]|uniref:vascular endothelial growth factor D-like n=1 Tax=Schistocerca piceifrons TaxID=274613 RepID=UPI001F5F5CD7|nr:vascular endothelial growth factor D-like [Schistocerca piceifrons]